MARKKTNKSFDNWKSTAVWLGSVLFVLIVLFLAVEQKSLMPLNTVDIDIKSTGEQASILTEEMLVQKIDAYLGFSLEEANINDLNLVELEHLIQSDDRVKHAEVYIDGNENIHIDVTQRKPILRVVSDAGENYYLDTEGNKINHVVGKAARVPVATGMVSTYDEAFLTEEYEGSLKEVHALAVQLQKDKFLHALIEQIEVDSRGEMTLIPKLGDEEIAFGHIDYSKEKLENIKEFYEHGLPASGWSKFSKLKFKWGKSVLFAEKK